MVWTHPKHKWPALLGFFFDAVGTVFISVALYHSTLYVDNRSDPIKEASIGNDVVECDDVEKICKFKGAGAAKAGWQSAVLYMMHAGEYLSLSSCVLQAIFWIAVGMGKVYGKILRGCSYIDALAGCIKFPASFIIIHVQYDINLKYFWFVEDAVQVSIFPAGLLQLSTILSFLALAMLRVATDDGAPGEPTYLWVIEEEKQEQEMVKELMRKSSIYKPTIHTPPRTVLKIGRRSSTSIY